ncbi:SRPBCC domain-containing protein [Myxococcus stipitatus]|uniref:SRPBCC domain-containing protein n=1 Tax=Myxococcus stipitatus TaxID=83455 RepID=UPI001F3F5D5C|nr:SRPBCC domain-containing protein [Myxococcus stipitatus]MCE9673244.1 SRPBCC domain-containing protein [Myxococcus stipitatus]
MPHGHPRGRTDTASHVVKAPAQAVYRAFVEPEAWVAWIPPGDMRGELSRFEPHPGGHYRMVLRYPSSTEHPVGKSSSHEDIVEGEFVDLVPGERVVQRVTFVSEDPRHAGVMTMTWALAPTEGGTRVTITCEDVPVGISAQDHDVGLRASLANLAAYVEGRATPSRT